MRTQSPWLQKERRTRKGKRKFKWKRKKKASKRMSNYVHRCDGFWFLFCFVGFCFVVVGVFFVCLFSEEVTWNDNALETFLLVDKGSSILLVSLPSCKYCFFLK